MDDTSNSIRLAPGRDGTAPGAVMVIGGLILSTLLTLLIVPAGFSLADGIERRMGPLLGRIFTNGGEHGHGGAPQAAE